MIAKVLTMEHYYTSRHIMSQKPTGRGRSNTANVRRSSRKRARTSYTEPGQDDEELPDSNASQVELEPSPMSLPPQKAGSSENEVKHELDSSDDDMDDLDLALKLTCTACSKPFEGSRGLSDHLADSESCDNAYSRVDLDQIWEQAGREKWKLIKEDQNVRLKGLRGDQDELPIGKQTCQCCQKSVLTLKQMAQHLEESKLCLEDFGALEYVKMRQQLTSLKGVRAEAMAIEKARLKRINDYYENREVKLEKAKEYYRKNRDEITRKKRANYLASNADESDPTVVRRALIQDPPTAKGQINIDLTAPVFFDTCQGQSGKDLPSSKVDHDIVEEFTTLGQGTSLTGRFVAMSELALADSFVGLSLSGDGESIEVKYLLERDDITIKGLQDLFHALMSVLEVDMKSVFCDKGCPIPVIPSSQIPLLRNKYTKEIVDDGRVFEEPKPVCFPVPTRESQFISEEMESIPFNQLILNQDLKPYDMGAIGLQCRFDDAETILIPLFTVNMSNWRFNNKYFFQVLIHWLGSKSKFLEVFLKTPCGIQAKALVDKDLQDDCYFNSLQPKKEAVCEHCGLQFEYNKYLFREVNRYKHHVETHLLDCKICGQSFPNATVRKFHQRTHKKGHVNCTTQGCKWVGNNTKSLATHIYFVHTRVLCDLCGKEVCNRNSLQLHRSTAHQPKVANFHCEICGKGYQTKGILTKHLKRHKNEDSLVNRWMNDNPNDYKFVCTMHDNCKKYFKSGKRLKAHKKNYENKDYPTNCATNFLPNMVGEESPQDLVKVPETTPGEVEIKRSSVTRPLPMPSSPTNSPPSSSYIPGLLSATTSGSSASYNPSAFKMESQD